MLFSGHRGGQARNRPHLRRQPHPLLRPLPRRIRARVGERSRLPSRLAASAEAQPREHRLTDPEAPGYNAPVKNSSFVWKKLFVRFDLITIITSSYTQRAE